MEQGTTPPSRARSSRTRAARGTRRGAGDDATIIPILTKMLRHAEDGSSAATFAELHLAEALVERNPWVASLHARRVVCRHPDAARAWAVLALGQTQLGNFRYAVRAYTRALELCPGNPAYAHNLGHLLDMALGASREALPYLEAAYETSGGCVDILTSLLHALVRSGHTERALRLVSESGAHGAALTKLRKLVQQLAGRPARRRRGAARRAPRVEPQLFAVLDAGLRHLPFGDYEIEAALTLAAEVMPCEPVQNERELRVTAAAIAWRVVCSSHLPLGAADVAAPFRVGLTAMRRRSVALESPHAE